MVEVSLQVAALLFPSVSLLLLAYTNRFLALAALVRSLHKEFVASGSDNKGLQKQIAGLRVRIALIRSMQTAGVISIFSSALCMIVVIFGYKALAVGLFTFALVAMSISLLRSLEEIRLSTNALDVLLEELD